MNEREQSNSSPALEKRFPASGSASQYYVGDLLVDVGRARVTRDGHIVALPRLSFDLLHALLVAAPNLMTLDAMMKRVWPGVVVSPDTVTQRVKVLRDALGDDPKSPRYIEGVRGRGYRLIADVTSTLPEPSEPPRGPDPVGQAPTFGRLRNRGIEVLAVLTIIATILIGYLAVKTHLTATDNTERQSASMSASSNRSIAVLPFENLSNVPDSGVIALGMSEAILHQLASLEQLTVIARTSSFAFEGQNQDVRQIARKLNARYLLEGSVQRDHARLRVTAQLIDAKTGGHVWSIRLDREPQDIFAVQDEIAQAVAKALQLSLQASADAGVSHQTQSVEAWLAFQQGRALVATRKISELERAKERFKDAVRIDPGFAAAYVGLAEAIIAEGFVAPSEFWITSVPKLSAADKTEVERLLEHALELDPSSGDAYLVRAWLEDDDSIAEGNYRRGLALSPNNAAGYAHYARLLFRSPGRGSDVFDPEKRQQALRMIDRARELDPLAPGHHIIKALMLDYGRSDWKGAIALSFQALAQDPNYYPALTKLAEFKWTGPGELAEAAKYAEQALVLEPHALWPRHMLSRIYLDLHEVEAARSVIEETGEPDPVGEVALEMFHENWERVGKLAVGLDTNIPGDWEVLEVAVFRAALASGKFSKGQAWLDKLVGLKWDENGQPVFEVQDYSKEGAVITGRFLQATGQAARAHKVLNAALRAMDRDAHELGRGDNWFFCSRAEALAVLGNPNAAIDTLIRGSAATFLVDFWFRVENEPAYATFRENARFRKLLDEQHVHVEKERKLLEAMRKEGLVPTRGAEDHPSWHSR